MDCIFCKIVSGDIPAEKIYEDEHCLAFLDIEPLSKGHTIVIPKAHAETILDLQDEKVQVLSLAVKKVVSKIEKGLSPDGFTIGINHKIGQAVSHLHIHVIPRWQGDGGGNIHSVVKNSPDEEIQHIAELLRKKG